MDALQAFGKKYAFQLLWLIVAYPFGQFLWFWQLFNSIAQIYKCISYDKLDSEHVREIKKVREVYISGNHPWFFATVFWRFSCFATNRSTFLLALYLQTRWLTLRCLNSWSVFVQDNLGNYVRARSKLYSIFQPRVLYFVNPILRKIEVPAVYFPCPTSLTLNLIIESGADLTDKAEVVPVHEQDISALTEHGIDHEIIFPNDWYCSRQ